MQSPPNKNHGSDSKGPRILHAMIFLALLTLPLVFVRSSEATAPGLLSTYQAIGPTVQMYYQIINNTSFETGTQPWTQISYNNYTSSVKVVPPGYNDNSAAQLIINSGNLTTDSHSNLLQDLSKNSVTFGNGLELRASVQTQIQGNTTTDRVEVSITLVTSIGNNTRVHYVIASGSTLPTNTTSDAYLLSNGTNSNGWTLLDRNVWSDAMKVFPALLSSLTSVKDVRLSVYATSHSIPTHDPRIKYIETDGDTFWNTTGAGTGSNTETVVFDPDADGFYNIATDKLLYNGSGPPPSNGQKLSDDPWIKFIDTNQNGQWDPGEAIVYDWHHDGVYHGSSIPADPIIYGNPIVGSLLQDPLHQQTMASFDNVELYTPAGTINWTHNGGFETGDLAGWGNIAGFKVVTSPTHSGSYSVNGTSSGTPGALAQGIESRPTIDATTSLIASGYVGRMTGITSADKADIWLGLVDSSPQANPLSVYYYFKTGAGTLPSNTTDTANYRVPSYGAVGKWLNLTQNLLPETRYFDSTGHTGPYRIEAAALEVSALTGQTTNAIFDDVSIQTSNHPTYYAVDGLNSTYVYNANRLAEGSFYFSVPGQQSVLNITSANGTPLQTGDYTTQSISSSLQITVPATTGLKYPAQGNWRIYTTSKNALARLQAATSGSTSPSSRFNTGGTIDFASQTKDPAGLPIAGSNVTMIFSAGNTLFSGKTDSQGWFNQTSIVLPSSPGTFALEAITVSSSYIGLRIIQLTTSSATPWALIAYISIAAVAAVSFGLLLFKRRRKARATPTKSAMQPGKSPNTQQTRPRKGK